MSTDVRKTIVEKMQEEFSLGKDASYRVCEAALDVIYSTAMQFGRVKVGTHIFKVSERKARTGRNPKTGESIKIPASRKVTYKNTAAKKKRD